MFDGSVSKRKDWDVQPGVRVRLLLVNGLGPSMWSVWMLLFAGGNIFGVCRQTQGGYQPGSRGGLRATLAADLGHRVGFVVRCAVPLLCA